MALHKLPVPRGALLMESTFLRQTLKTHLPLEPSGLTSTMAQTQVGSPGCWPGAIDLSTRARCQYVSSTVSCFHKDVAHSETSFKPDIDMVELEDPDNPLIQCLSPGHLVCILDGFLCSLMVVVVIHENV